MCNFTDLYFRDPVAVPVGLLVPLDEVLARPQTALLLVGLWVVRVNLGLGVSHPPPRQDLLHLALQRFGLFDITAVVEYLQLSSCQKSNYTQLPIPALRLEKKTLQSVTKTTTFSIFQKH